MALRAASVVFGTLSIVRGLVAMACLLVACARPQPSAPARPVIVAPERPPHVAPRPTKPLDAWLPVQVYRDGSGVLLADVRINGAFPSPAKQKMQQGTPVEVTWRVNVFAAHEAKPRASGAFRCRIAFDVWQEIFVVKTSLSSKPHITPTLKGVSRKCFDVQEIPLSVYGRFVPGEEYRINAIAVVDPPQPAPTFSVEGVYAP